MMMDVESSESETSTVISNLITSLEQASLMAKHLPTTTTTNQSQLHQIHAALQSAHHHLSLFLSHHPPENPISSALGGETGEPMQMGDDDDDNPKATTVDKVEEKMKDCFIQNKRPKRQLSPSAEQRRRSYENVAEMGGATAAEFGFDPIGTKLRALDLIYQFHA